MRVTRLFTGADGESHFEDVDVETTPHGDIGSLSAVVPATGVVFRETPAEYCYDWHNAPRRQYVVMLEGSVEIEVGDGTCRRFDLLIGDSNAANRWRALDRSSYALA